MPGKSILPKNRPSRGTCVQIAAATAISVLALSAVLSSARAQTATQSQPQGTPLPTVPIEPPAAQSKQTPPAVRQAAPAPKVAPRPAVKRAQVQAQPGRRPAQTVNAPPAPPAVAEVPPPPALALGTYNPALDLRDLALPAGTALTTGGPVQGYRALSAMSSTKTATPIEQVPQSIQVLPRSLLDDQKPVTVTEAIQNASNAQGVNSLNIGNTDLQPIRIRGFGAEQWLDGVPVPYNTGDRDALANVERIEVLKGPSAILYGGGTGAPVGGAVNIVSKLPTNRAFGEFGVTFGSHAFVRPYFDVNQPLTSNGTMLFRVTGEYTNADSFVDVLHSERYAINPTLTDKTNTTLTIQARASRWEQQAYPGLPAVGTVAGNFRIDRSMFAGDPGIMPSYTEVRGVTVTLDHKLDSIWSVNIKGRVTKSEFDQNSQGPSTAAPDLTMFGPSVWSLLNTELFQSQNEFMINPNVQAKFDVGPTRNTVLVGGDYSRVTDKGFMNTDLAAGFVDLVTVFGAEPVDARVVRDRNRITGAGVTAGLDFGLTIVAERRDAEYAKGLQLLAEYHPQPPFDAGTPNGAGPETTAMMQSMFTEFLVNARRIGEAAMRKS